VTLTSNTSTVCSLSNRTLTLISEGECIVTASQAGNSQYLSATNVDRVITISKALQTIIIGNAYGEVGYVGTQGLFFENASSGLKIEYESLTPSVCDFGGSALGLKSEGTCKILARQSGNALYAPSNTIEKTIRAVKQPGQVLFTIAPNSPMYIPIPYQSNLRVEVLGGGDADLTSTTLSVCSASPVVNNTATLYLIGPGNCSLTASHPGSGIYLPSSRTINIMITVPKP